MVDRNLLGEAERAADRPAQELVAALAAELAHAPSGVGFIYEALDRLVAEHSLTDAMLVVSTPAGRQVFRAGRRPVRGDWAQEHAAAGEPGLYTDPVLLHPDEAESLTNLCAVAFRLEVLAHDASHDALTGLLNRRSFDDTLNRAVSRSVRYGWNFTLVLMDLNRFKQVNDRLGHPAGDEVLRAVGRGLRSFLRASDVAARLGGDEFAVILDGTDPELGRGLSERLSTATADMIGWADVAFAVGSATAPDEATTASELYRLADRRLYEAKGVA
ncbi:MAG TPA: GGDEF domain-containing protein [Acidimicrobiales bacterium]|nr:GGDEF domain-containing protein [Acidimicrobiales bacterium]